MLCAVKSLYKNQIIFWQSIADDNIQATKIAVLKVFKVKLEWSYHWDDSFFSFCCMFFLCLQLWNSRLSFVSWQYMYIHIEAKFYMHVFKVTRFLEVQYAFMASNTPHKTTAQLKARDPAIG